MSTVKIDRSFVSAASSPANQSIIRSICDMASNFGMEVVAEGIETEDQWQFLRSVGCHAGQGYLFHRPEEAASAIEVMTAHHVGLLDVLLALKSTVHAA
jgi:EAL domain-containing protein (putative c-di-GMP-specific phosphodiesterase class I)